MSFSVGSLVFASFWDERKIGPCFWVASSNALMDRCRPTKSGTTMWGNTMISRRRSRGTVARPPASLSLSSFLSLRNNITVPLCALGRLAVNDNRRLVAGHHLFRDDNFLNIGLRGHLIHDIEHDVFHNRPETPGPGLAFHGLSGNPPERLFRELEVHALHLEQLRILLGQRVLRLLQNAHQRALVELIEGRQNRQAADELRNESEL